MESREEDFIGQLGDDDPFEPDVEGSHRRRHQVVGDRAVRRDPSDLESDRIRLGHADPDRYVAVCALLLEDHDVLAGGHVNPD